MKCSDRFLLFDANALVALAWPNHQFHRAVVDRLERRPEASWATCAFTQLAFVRLSSNPRVVGVQKTPSQALALLVDLVSDSRHRYVDALPVPHELQPDFSHLLGYRQVTDAYLLAVAARNDGILLTLDRRVSPSGPRSSHLEVLVA